MLALWHLKLEVDTLIDPVLVGGPLAGLGALCFAVSLIVILIFFLPLLIRHMLLHLICIEGVLFP